MICKLKHLFPFVILVVFNGQSQSWNGSKFSPIDSNKHIRFQILLKIKNYSNPNPFCSTRSVCQAFSWSDQYICKIKKIKESAVQQNVLLHGYDISCHNIPIQCHQVKVFLFFFSLPAPTFPPSIINIY